MKKARCPADAGYRALNKDVYEIGGIIPVTIVKPAEPTKSGRKIFYTSAANFPPETENRPPDTRSWGARWPVLCAKACQNRLTAGVTVTEKACARQASKRHFLTIQQ
ncbi:hypothetical protein MSS88_01450 [bacterium]|nr:hypothetical protein [bacterium]MCI7743479.1 hypothetical protein [bacterium]